MPGNPTFLLFFDRGHKVQRRAGSAAYDRPGKVNSNSDNKQQRRGAEEGRGYPESLQYRMLTESRMGGLCGPIRTGIPVGA